jgi:hypothetical protein
VAVAVVLTVVAQQLDQQVQEEAELVATAP